MIHLIFSVYDEGTNAYLQPFFMPTSNAAVRAISDLANDPKHNFCRHASDYTLFEIGSYNDANARIDAYKTPKAIAKAIELRAKAGNVSFPDNGSLFDQLNEDEKS